MKRPTAKAHRDRDVEGIDPDIVFISDFLSDRLSTAERERFELRFADDDAFYRKAMPLMVAADLIDVPRELEIAQAELAQQRAVDRATRPIASLLTRKGWIGLAVASVVFITLMGIGHKYNPPWFLTQPRVPAADYATAANEIRSVRLSDGSQVSLASNSKVHSEEHFLNMPLVVAVDGIVTIEVPPTARTLQVRGPSQFIELAAGGTYVVNTRTPQAPAKFDAVVLAPGGTYTIDMPRGDPLALSVSVVHGGAALVSADGSQRVPVPAGNTGRVTSAGEVIVAPVKDTTDTRNRKDTLTRGKPE